MSEGTFNWGELMASAGDFEPLAKGKYDVYVDTAEATQSATGKLMFKIRYKVEAGPNSGRTVFNNVTVSPENQNAMRYFFMNMKAMGIGPDFFASNPSPSTIASALVGNRCGIEVDHREYQGQMRENVKSIFPAVGGGGPAGAFVGGPSGLPGGSSIPQPTSSTPSPSPSPQPAAQPVSAPVQPVVPAAPAQAAPVQQESTAVIPAPQNPAVDTSAPVQQAAPVQEAPAQEQQAGAPVPPPLPF